MRRLTAEDYAVDAVTAYPPSEASAGGGSTRGAKALVGAWLCRRLDDGTAIRRGITETEAYCGEDPHRLRLLLQARPRPQVALYA